MTVSDREVKSKFCAYLLQNGFQGVSCKNCKVGGDGFDVSAECDGERYLFELKSSSKKNGNFFGTVMLTELHKAITSEHYFFVLARRSSQEWQFDIYTVEQFLKFCTLTTPIFHYRIKENERKLKQPNARRYQEGTVRASKEVIEQMWQFFRNIRSEFGQQKNDKAVLKKAN